MRQHPPLSLGLLFGLATTLGLGIASSGSPALAEQASTSEPAVGYPWLADLDPPLPATTPLSQRFPTPAGFTRVPAAPGSYAAWLRGLPLRTDRSSVLAYDGTELRRPSAAVLLLDVGRRDLMQCADSIIRLHAEYLWATGKADEASYRFTSGDRSRWKDWRAGERFRISGNSVQRVSGKARANKHTNFRRWLDLIFTYAGTTSLARDTSAPAAEAPTLAGDFFVDPGFPGHAVIVLDVAQDKGGQHLALLAQGFMPAEEVHVLESVQAIDGHWFPLPQIRGDVLNTPSWTPFQPTARRRFR